MLIFMTGDAMARPLIEAYEKGGYDGSSLVAVASSAAIFSRPVKERWMKAFPNTFFTDSVVIKDDNPTRRPPYLTIGLIVACALVFLYTLSLPADGSADSQLGFSCEYGLVADHLVNGEERDAPAPRTFEEACVELNQEHNRFLGVLTSLFLHGGWLHFGGGTIGGVQRGDGGCRTADELGMDAGRAERPGEVGDGHQAVQDTAIGKTRYDAAKKMVVLEDILRFPADCVNPPASMKSEEWIKAGFPGAKGCP